MDYVLNGVENSGNIRRYAFAEFGDDFSHTAFSVAVDIDVVRK